MRWLNSSGESEIGCLVSGFEVRYPVTPTNYPYCRLDPCPHQPNKRIHSFHMASASIIHHTTGRPRPTCSFRTDT